MLLFLSWFNNAHSIDYRYVASRGEDPSRGTGDLSRGVAAATTPSTPDPAPSTSLLPIPLTTITGESTSSSSTDPNSEDPSNKRGNEELENRDHRETWIHDPEWLRVESWLDEHPDFCLDYFLR